MRHYFDRPLLFKNTKKPQLARSFKHSFNKKNVMLEKPPKFYY